MAHNFVPEKRRKMDQDQTQSTDILAEAAENEAPETDIFLWANNMVPIKEELRIELFFFNKNYVVYKTQVNKNLHRELEQLFIDNLLDFVLDGAEKGMQIRGFEDAETEENVLQRTQLSKVENAKMVLNWLQTQEHEIEHFVEEEHDFKRIKGMLVRCSHPTLEKPFYIIKALSQSSIMKGKPNWMLRNGTFVAFDAEGALKPPADNQLLILEQDLYVFNQAKLTSLFGYDVKKYAIAEEKLNFIGQNFRLSISEEQSIGEMVKGKKSLVNKLQKLDPTKVSQHDLIKHAEDLDLPLMTDDSGKIIIMDSKDLTMFVNLLNEDYVQSSLTGARYEITKKKPLKEPDEKDLLKQYS